MIKPDSKVIDDIAKLAGGAVGVVNEVRQSIQQDIRERVDVMAANMDLIPRDEFERLEALVKAQADEIDALKGRISALESQDSAPKKTTAKKTSAKKSS